MARSLLGLVGQQLSNRAPVPYTARTAFSELIHSGGAPKAALEAYGSVGMLFAVVARLADTTSDVVWHLNQVVDGRGKVADPSGKREVFDHQLVRLMKNPNPFYTQKSVLGDSAAVHGACR